MHADRIRWRGDPSSHDPGRWRVLVRRERRGPGVQARPRRTDRCLARGDLGGDLVRAVWSDVVARGLALGEGEPGKPYCWRVLTTAAKVWDATAMHRAT